MCLTLSRERHKRETPIEWWLLDLDPSRIIGSLDRRSSRTKPAVSYKYEFPKLDDEEEEEEEEEEEVSDDEHHEDASDQQQPADASRADSSAVADEANHSE